MRHDHAIRDAFHLTFHRRYSAGRWWRDNASTMTVTTREQMEPPAPLVGRATVLDALGAALERAVGGSGGCVFVEWRRATSTQRKQ
jgi:hypothetical protein